MPGMETKLAISHSALYICMRYVILGCTEKIRLQDVFAFPDLTNKILPASAKEQAGSYESSLRAGSLE